MFAFVHHHFFLTVFLLSKLFTPIHMCTHTHLSTGMVPTADPALFVL